MADTPLGPGPHIEPGRFVVVDAATGDPAKIEHISPSGDAASARVDESGGLVLSDTEVFRQILIELRLANRIAFMASNLTDDFESLRRDAESEIDMLIPNS